MMKRTVYDAVVVGGGAAGIGVGVALKDAGLENFVVLERHKVGSSFAAWPERLYVIDSAGNIGYKGLNGPDGYLPEEVRSWLEANVAEK